MANNGARPNSESSSFPCKRLPRYSEASSWGTGKNLGVHAATACSSDESVGDHPVYLPSSPLISAQRAWSNICAPDGRNLSGLTIRVNREAGAMSNATFKGQVCIYPADSILEDYMLFARTVSEAADCLILGKGPAH